MITLGEIKERCRNALAGTPVRKAILFGSYARGTQSRRSDIDLVLVEETDKPLFQRHEDFGELYSAFKNEEVDFLFYTPAELTFMAHRRFIRSILEEGVIVYER
jgi:predicted nucleotidyltransferase